MLGLEDVVKRRDELVVKLDKAIKELKKFAYKEDASVTLVKRYNKYIQNKKNLSSIEVNETNYKYIMRDIRAVEVDVNKYFKEHPEALEAKDEETNEKKITVLPELTPEEKAKKEHEAFQETMVKFFKFAGAGKKEKVKANAMVYGDTLF